MEWVSWAVAHDYKDFFWVKANIAWTYYLAGRYEEALQVLKGDEATHSMAAHDDLRSAWAASTRRRLRSPNGLKTGFHSILAETCLPVREPMKHKYLDDLRKAGVPERAERASP